VDALITEGKVMGINLGAVAAVMANFNSVSQRSTVNSDKKDKINVNILTFCTFKVPSSGLEQAP